MNQVWRSWVALMDRRESPTALALVRIGCALVLLCDQLWVAHVGLVEPMWTPSPGGFATGAIGWAQTLGLSAWGLWALVVAALSCVLVGVGTRAACIVFVLGSAQQAQLAPNCESAIDQLMRIVFVILALSRCHAKWSLDAIILRRLSRPMPALVPAWPRYLLLLQLVWVYFSSGVNKNSAAWGPHGGFTALANALMDPANGRLDPELVVALYPLTRVATALTMVFELTALAYLVWLYFAATPEGPGRLRTWSNRLRLRWVWIGLGVSFQIGIAIGLRLGAFPFGMLALFPVLLLPHEVERLFQWRKTRAPAKRASSPS
jgi:Vitamin K-dependent gamma-carboxylase